MPALATSVGLPSFLVFFFCKMGHHQTDNLIGSYWTGLCKLQRAIHCARCMTHRALQVSRCQISVACGIPCLVVFGRRVASTHTNTWTLPTSKAIQLSFWLFASYQQDLDMFQTFRILACSYCRFALDLHSCMGWLESAGLALQNAQHLHWRFTSTPTQLPEPCQLECSAWGHTHTQLCCRCCNRLHIFRCLHRPVVLLKVRQNLERYYTDTIRYRYMITYSI